jgi:hypothetical protein
MRGTASMPRYDAAEICEVAFSYGLRHCPTFASTPGEVSGSLRPWVLRGNPVTEIEQGAAARPASAPQSQINNHPARRRQGSALG